MGKLAVVTLILMSSGCTAALRYPWDKLQDTQAQTPKKLPTPPPAATPTPTPTPSPIGILTSNSTSTLEAPGFWSLINCHGDPVHNTLLVCDISPTPTPEVKK